MEWNPGLGGNAVLGHRFEDDAVSPPEQSEHQDMDEDEEGGGDDAITDLQQARHGGA